MSSRSLSSPVARRNRMKRTSRGWSTSATAAQLYLDCQGSGSPTVFIIPGKGSYAEVWNVVVPADDPIRSSPYDMIGEADLGPSPTATATHRRETTRVCVLRPAQHPPRRIRPVHPGPATALRPAGCRRRGETHCSRGSFDTVAWAATSYGGLIADLLARTHPALVSGLVFVDPTSEFLPRLGRPDQDAEFDRRPVRHAVAHSGASSPMTHSPVQCSATLAGCRGRVSSTIPAARRPASIGCGSTIAGLSMKATRCCPACRRTRNEELPGPH